MNDLFPFLLFALVAVVAVVVAQIVAQRRREALSAVAARLGLGFDAGGSRTFHRTLRHALFQKGRSRRAYNMLSGTVELAGYPVRVDMGDYSYVTGSGRSRQTHRTSFAAFRLPFFGVPSLLVRKEGIGDKLVGGLGFDDIDFESEEFSRMFWVKSSNKRFAYDVIHPRMMEFLMESATPRIEILDDVCLLQEGLGRWAPDRFSRAARWFDAFLSRWPEHLTEELPERRGGMGGIGGMG